MDQDTNTEKVNTIGRKLAQIAADLWIEQIQKPLNKDNGDDNPMLFMLASMNTMSAQDNLTNEKITVFRESLTEQIIKELHRYPDLSFGVDYNPDSLLAEAAQAAGIDPSCFPWKSYMHVRLDKHTVEYRFGYSSQWQTIQL